MEALLPHITAGPVLSVVIVIYLIIREFIIFNRRKNGDSIVSAKEEILRALQDAERAETRAAKALDAKVSDAVKVENETRTRIINLNEKMRELSRDNEEMRTSIRDIADAIREDTRSTSLQNQKIVELLATMTTLIKVKHS